MIDYACPLSCKKCVPCEGGVAPLKGSLLQALGLQLNKGWEIIDEHHLIKTYKFPDFATALAFTNLIGAIAEEEGHHPEVTLSWGSVQVKIWTHKIDGLTENDFILAAKCDAAICKMSCSACF